MLIPPSIWKHLWFIGLFEITIASRKVVLVHPGVKIENEVFWTNTFRSEALALSTACRFSRFFGTFLDIGANTGIYSIFVASSQPDIAILAFEPSRTNFEVLVSNSERNELGITCLEAAVSDVDSTLDFYDFPGHSYSASLESSWREGTRVRKVAAVRLDSALRDTKVTGPYLVKVDVEGHEPGVLRGLQQTIDSSVPPSFLIEIIRSNLFVEIKSILPPSRFHYYFCDEEAAELIDMTDRVLASADLSSPSLGNYFVIPIASIPHFQSCLK